MATRAFIIRVTLAYGVGALIWIYFSDLLIINIGGSPELAAFSTFKGFGFVTVTSALLVVVLRRMANIARVGEEHHDAPRRPWPLFLLVLAIAVPVIVVSALVYNSASQALLKERQSSLSAIAKLQAESLSRHLSQRADAAHALARSSLLRDAVSTWLDQQSAEDLGTVRAMLDDTANALGFSSIELWGPTGHRLMWEGRPGDERADVRLAIPQAVHSKQILFVARQPGVDRYGFLVPVMRGADPNGDVVALLYLDMTADTFIYPFLAHSPGASAASATFLARKINGAWRFASPLEGIAGPTMSQPMPSGLAALAEGAEKGPHFAVTDDQLGHQVLAVARQVPNSPSTLITKIDTQAALGEARGLTLFSGVTLASSLAVALVFSLLFSERQKLRAALREVNQAKALAEAEERFELAVRGADEGVFDINVETGGSYFSPRWRELMSLPMEGPIDVQKDWSDRIHPDDLPHMDASWESVVEGAARSFEVEFRHLNADGTYHDLFSRGYAVMNGSGKAVRIVGLTADISERKQTERRLRLASTVFSGTDEGIVVTDVDGLISAINPAFSAITGYEESEVLGHSMNLMQSGRHDRQFYRQMWDAIRTAGTWRGEVWNRRKDGEVYLQQLIISAVYNAEGEPQSFVGAFHDITQFRRSQFELDHITHYDPLTDLPNRTLLFSLIEHAASRPGARCAVLFADLDHFKTVNDSLGLVAGDSVLQAVARRIHSSIPAEATLGRYGADEFVILIEDAKSSDDIATIAARVIAALKDPFVGDNRQEIYVGASIGISLYPDDAATAQILLQHAHSALFQAKASGRGAYSFYTGALTRAARARIALEADLRRALAQGELQVYYQPIMELADLRLSGAEALVRWQSPTGGLIMPNDFIPLAEDTGLIVPLGHFVMEEACRQLMEWGTGHVPCAYVSVNLSPRQFNQPDLCRRVADTLRATGLPPGQLELEITERILFDDQAQAERKVAELAEMGVKVAVDDFGTGYSSLGYLKRFPVGKLKIDKSFVQDLPQSAVDGEIVRAVIGVGRALGLEVLAEGVETPEQMDFLRAAGCRLGQGYLWSRPVPPAAFRTFALANGAISEVQEKG